MSVLLMGLIALMGAGLLRAGFGPGDGLPGLCFRFGGGFILGFVLLGACLELWGDGAVEASRWPVLIALLAASSWAAWGAWRGRSAGVHEAKVGSLLSVAEWALSLGLLAVGGALALQVEYLPTLAWDGWNAWLAKARGWAEAGHWLTYQALGSWLQHPSGTAATAAGAAYPEAVPRAVTWLLAWEGGWSESIAHRPWLALWIGLAGLCFGGLRELRVPAGVAVLTTLALLCMPLLLAHVALAGYVDLWLAGLLLLSVFSLLHFRTERSLGTGLLLGLCLVLMARVKLEGAVYALLLASVWGLWQLPARIRWSLVTVLSLAPLALWAGWVVSLPVPGLGWVTLRWGAFDLPILGELVLHWRPVGSAVLNALFVLPTFSLLWYLAILVPVWRWRALRDRRWAPAMAFLGAAALFHFLLFFFTDASAWAENLTSLNRLLLHVAPAWAVMLCLLWVHPSRLTAQRYGRYSKLR